MFVNDNIQDKLHTHRTHDGFHVNGGNYSTLVDFLRLLHILDRIF